MKKIFNICLLSVAAAGFIACSDNDDAGSGYLRENSVQVVSSSSSSMPTHRKEA